VKARVIIVDDHPIFRMGMAELLNQEDDFTVCGLAEDIASARKLILEHTPDLAIVDITLAGDNGLDLVKELAGRGIPFLACKTCLTSCGMSREKLIDGVKVGGMSDLAKWVVESDNVLVF